MKWLILVNRKKLNPGSPYCFPLIKGSLASFLNHHGNHIISIIRIHWFIHSSIHSFIHPSIHSFIHPFINLLTQPFIHSCIHRFLNSSIHPFTHFLHSCIPSFLPSFLYSFIPSFLHSFIHSVIHFSSVISCISFHFNSLLSNSPRLPIRRTGSYSHVLFSKPRRMLGTTRVFYHCKVMVHPSTVYIGMVCNGMALHKTLEQVPLAWSK